MLTAETVCDDCADKSIVATLIEFVVQLCIFSMFWSGAHPALDKGRMAVLSIWVIGNNFGGSWGNRGRPLSDSCGSLGRFQQASAVSSDRRWLG